MREEGREGRNARAGGESSPVHLKAPTATAQWSWISCLTKAGQPGTVKLSLCSWAQLNETSPSQRGGAEAHSARPLSSHLPQYSHTY